MKETPKQLNVAITRGLPHRYWPPPHCRASKRHIIDGMNMVVPIGSKRLKICHHVLSWRSEDLPVDFGRNNMTTTSAMPPIGKLTTFVSLDHLRFQSEVRKLTVKTPSPRNSCCECATWASQYAKTLRQSCTYQPGVLRRMRCQMSLL